MTAAHVLDLLAELRRHAQVFPRYRANLPAGAVKGVALANALAAVAEHGGSVEQSEVWLLPHGGEVLTPWQPYTETIHTT